MDLGPPPPDGDVSRGAGIVQEYAVLASVATLVVALRLISRFKSRGLGADDYLMTTALVRAILPDHKSEY